MSSILATAVIVVPSENSSSIAADVKLFFSLQAASKGNDRRRSGRMDTSREEGWRSGLPGLEALSVLRLCRGSPSLVQHEIAFALAVRRAVP
jgi:hypothetical protein